MSHIFLYGPPGTGKSTIGKILARNLNLRFVDLDRIIEANAAMSIQDIMDQQGEMMFRDFETSSLKMVVHEEESVIALGGGALLRESNRKVAESNGKVLLLMAKVDTLLERLNHDATKRPLLAGDLREKLLALLVQRDDHYGSFPYRMHVDGKTARQNAQQAQNTLGRYHLSAMGKYEVLVENLDQAGRLLYEAGLQKPIVVTDKNVAGYQAEKVLDSLRRFYSSPGLLTVPAGESSKTLETVNLLWHGFLGSGLDRKSTVVALGGGVIGDLAGFAASTYMRGINWVAMPTTLLSMVDASLGGKTGFDLPEGKNLVGSFYPPRLVLADPQTLNTLPEAELLSGLAEVVKHGVISDPELFQQCARGLDWIKDNLEDVVKRAMAVKIKVIEEDPYEKGFRAALNLGHTVGHAVELVSKFQLKHGEAVAIGMVAEAKLAERLTVAHQGLTDQICEVLTGLKLPIQTPNELPRTEILRAMKVDKKKNASAIRFALPANIGKVELVDVTDLEMVLEEL